MALRKIYSFNTTDGKRWGIGIFENSQMLKPVYPYRNYKTLKGAKKGLIKIGGI